MRITVLSGGANTERDVSLASGRAVADALRRAGHRVAEVDTAVPSDIPVEDRFTTEESESDPEVRIDPPAAGELRELRARRTGRVLAEGVLESCLAAEVVVPMIFGDEGESGHVQAVLDWLGVTYAGPGPLGCALSFDKEVAKRLIRDAGIPTSDWRLVRGAALEEDLGAVDLRPPWVVKPVQGGSTIGTALAEDRDELASAVGSAVELAGSAVVERYLPGREFSVSLLGTEPLPVVEIRTGRTLFDYVAKYQTGEAEELCPAPIDDHRRDELWSLARAALPALRIGPRTFCRVDFRCDAEEQPHFLEVNGLPGMTATSVYPRAAAAAGMDLAEVCDRIVRLTVGE